MFMGIIAKITSLFMPIIKHPNFKTICYIAITLTVLFLIYFSYKTRKKTKEALKKKEISAESHPWSSVILILFFISLSFGLLANVLDWNEPGKITVLDNGNVITKTRPYISVGAKPKAVYYKKRDYLPPKRGDKREKPIKMTFKDFGEAQTDYGFTLELPQDAEKIKRIHRRYGSQEKLLYSGVKPFISEAIKIGAKLLKSEESSKEKEEKLIEFIKDQMTKGLYVVERGEIKRDEKGILARRPSPFAELKVKFKNIELKNIRYEDMVTTLEKQKIKILERIKHLETLEITRVSSLNEIEREIHGHIKKAKGLTKEQKERIIRSINVAKTIIIKLKEREKKTLTGKKKSEKRVD